MGFFQKYKNGFTLVELVIVITILTILSTIAFVSFQNYTKDARDANRIGSINSIQQGLHLSYAKEGGYPIPENYISIYASGNLIGYQGVFGDSSSRMVNLNNTPIDPLEKTYFTYNLNASGDAYQIIGFFENNAITFGNIFTSKSYASSISYSSKTIKSYGDELGVLVGSTGSYINTPLQELTNNISFNGIDLKFFTGTLSNGTNIGELKAVFNNNEHDNIIGTGSNLIRLENIYKQKMQIVMASCPKEWEQKGFVEDLEGVGGTIGCFGSKCKICESTITLGLPKGTQIPMETCPNEWINKGYLDDLDGIGINPICGTQTCKICESAKAIPIQKGIQLPMVSCPNGWAQKGFIEDSSIGGKIGCLGDQCKICQKN